MQIKLVELKKCCCCFPLLTGSRVIAYLNAIPLLILFVLNAYYEVHFYYRSDETKLSLNDTVHIGMDAVGLTLHLVFGIYAIIGTYEETPSLILSWVLFEFTAILLAAGRIIVFFIRIWRRGIWLHPELNGYVIFIVLYTYFILVFHSLYKKLLRDKNDKEKVTWRRDTAAVD